MSNIIDGKKLAQKKEAELKKRVSELKSTPKVISFLIGNNPASVLYTNMKQQKAKELGIDFEPLKYSENISFNEALEKLISLNNDPKITGIMFQLPLPKEFLGGHKIEELLELIDSKKDIDMNMACTYRKIAQSGTICTTILILKLSYLAK